jgi:hypothetical protein
MQARRGNTVVLLGGFATPAVALHFIRPGRPLQNCFIESFKYSY